MLLRMAGNTLFNGLKEMSDKYNICSIVSTSARFIGSIPAAFNTERVNSLLFKKPERLFRTVFLLDENKARCIFINNCGFLQFGKSSFRVNNTALESTFGFGQKFEPDKSNKGLMS